MKLDNLSFLPLFFLGLTSAGAQPADALAPPAASSPHVRPMSTDRPDTTESAYTVPAGMFQVEMSFFDLERDADAGTRTEALSWGQMNVKAGLASDLDLQVVFDVHQELRETTGRSTAKQSGFGDVTVRLKKNLWGNDEGRSALALMPFVSIPTGSELSADAWQSGLVAPFAYSLTERIGLGFMGQVDLVHDEDTGGVDLQWLISGTVGMDLTERLGGFVELVGMAGEDMAAMALFNSGLTFAVSDNCILDAGVRIGLNRAAPDVGLFSGVSFRF